MVNPFKEFDKRLVKKTVMINRPEVHYHRINAEDSIFDEWDWCTIDYFYKKKESNYLTISVTPKSHCWEIMQENFWDIIEEDEILNLVLVNVVYDLVEFYIDLTRCETHEKPFNIDRQRLLRHAKHLSASEP